MSVLEGAQAKVGRAETQRAEVEALSKRYRRGAPARLEIIEEEKGARMLIGRLLTPPPQELSLAIGDMLHNLASALDHATVAMFDLERKAAPARVQFPRTSVAADFESRCAGNLSGLSAEVIDIFRALEVYPSGAGATLYELIQLDIQDKHKSVLPVVSATITGPVNLFRMDCSIAWKGVNMAREFGPDGRALFIRSLEPVAIVYELEPPKVLLSLRKGFAGEPPLLTHTQRFFEAVNGVLKKLVALEDSRKT